MAAARKYRQRDKSLPNYIGSYRERQKFVKHGRAPGPLMDRRAPVICTGFLPPSASKVRETADQSCAVGGSDRTRHACAFIECLTEIFSWA
jgi:hypothetical protein